MSARTLTVCSVNVGRVREVAVHGRKVRTAFFKAPVSGEVEVTPLGLRGDEQADTVRHGGLSKALYAYPREHHAFWQTVRAQARVSLWDEPLSPGALGENLTLQGLLENQVWIGDVLRFPHCTLAVSEPRLPCGRLNLAMGFEQASQLMAQSGWCGFYLAVREPGRIEAGQGFELVAGPREVSVGELFSTQMRRQSTG
jgi:MOSC domain-containing protein YiiM